MESQKILNSDYLDILFDGRNKSYGGYELRKNYSSRLGKALSLLIVCTILTTAYAFIGKAKPVGKDIKIERPVELTQPPLNPETPPMPPTPPPPPSTPAAPTIQNTVPILADDNHVPDDDIMPTQDDMRNLTIGASTLDGDSVGIDPTIITKGTSGGAGVTAPPPSDKPAIYVEQMPAPPYNMNTYLANNLRYPQMAKDNNIEGKVLIQFVISETGAISDVMVVGKRKQGGGLEEEAVRVVQGMPKWTPGKQNGVAVKVCYTLPINFELN